MRPLKEKTGITLDEEIVEKIKDLAEKEAAKEVEQK